MGIYYGGRDSVQSRELNRIIVYCGQSMLSSLWKSQPWREKGKCCIVFVYTMYGVPEIYLATNQMLGIYGYCDSRSA